MAPKVVIEEEECVGCEACVELCPEIFEFDEDNEKALVKMPEGGDEDCINEAMDSCPSDCITYE